MISALGITVKPVLGDHPFVKLKWSLKTGGRSMKGHLLGQVLTLYNKKTVLTNCVNDIRPIPL